MRIDRFFYIVLFAAVAGCSSDNIKDWSNAISSAPQKIIRSIVNDQYYSIGQEVLDCEEKIESMGHKDSALEQLILALKHVKPEGSRLPPENWSVIYKYIDEARGSEGYNFVTYGQAEELIRNVYLEYLRIKGQNKVDQFMGYAKEKAGGGNKFLVDLCINEAETCANETGAKVNPKLVKEIYQIYEKEASRRNNLEKK